jgi:zinc D-Ala-D-Ala carboxypeptidase
MDWSKYSPFFKKEEFDCKHTGDNEMKPEFMDKLLAIRKRYGKPMWVTSGYRSPKHPIEAAKKASGAHSTGRACDVAIQGSEALELLKIALEEGMTGIGVQQKGSGRFLHLDDVTEEIQRPWIWSY